MLTHEFFILENEDILMNLRWFIDFDVPRNCINVHDDIILNNPLFLKGFKSFKVSLNNPGVGLDYQGITIIPSTSLDDFLNNVIFANEIKIIPEKITKCSDGEIFKSKAIKIKPEIHNQLNDLILLIKEAKDKELYIIHFGI